MSMPLEQLARPERDPDFTLGDPTTLQLINYWEAKPGRPGVVEAIRKPNGTYSEQTVEPYYDTRYTARASKSTLAPVYRYLGIAVHGVEAEPGDPHVTRATTLHPESYVPRLRLLSPDMVDFAISEGDTYSRFAYARNWDEGRATVATRRVGQAHDLHAHTLPAFEFLTPRAVEAIAKRAAFGLTEGGSQLQNFMNAADFGLHGNDLGSQIMMGLEGNPLGWEGAARSISVVAHVPGRPIPDISAAELKAHATGVVAAAQAFGPAR